jgi:competence protein ComGC
MIEFNCDKCNQQLSISDNLAGQQTQCPACKAILAVPTCAVGDAQEPAGSFATPIQPPQLSPLPTTGYPTPPIGLPSTNGSSKALALAAFILGLCSIIPCLGFITGLLAIIFAIIALVKKTTRTWMAVTGLVLGITFPMASAVLPAIFVPVLGQARELARQAACQANMATLGQGMSIYKTEYKDVCPPNLDTLIKSGNVSEQSLHCPSSWNSPTSRDYIYVCPIKMCDPKTIIACDCGTWHTNGGRSILYTDGSVRFAKTDADFQAELAKPINAKFAAAMREAQAK